MVEILEIGTKVKFHGSPIVYEIFARDFDPDDDSDPLYILSYPGRNIIEETAYRNEIEPC